MDGGDRAVADAELLVDHLDHGCQAVGGAGRGGDDAVLGRVEQVLVDAHDDIQRAPLLHRGAHHHSFHALVEVGLEHRDGLHLAAGLDHQIAIRPIGVGDGLVGSDLDALAADHHAIALGTGLVVPAAVYRVEVQQMREGRRVTRRVIDTDELELRPAPGGAQRQTTDTTETVDTDFDTHAHVLSCLLREKRSPWLIGAGPAIGAGAQQQEAARSGRSPMASRRWASGASQCRLASSAMLSTRRTQSGRSGCKR
ncbi:hypothetical protein D9M70_158370 [compost metagenome]